MAMTHNPVVIHGSGIMSRSTATNASTDQTASNATLSIRSRATRNGCTNGIGTNVAITSSVMPATAIQGSGLSNRR